MCVQRFVPSLLFFFWATNERFWRENKQWSRGLKAIRLHYYLLIYCTSLLDSHISNDFSTFSSYHFRSCGMCSCSYISAFHHFFAFVLLCHKIRQKKQKYVHNLQVHIRRSLICYLINGWLYARISFVHCNRCKLSRNSKLVLRRMTKTYVQTANINLHS